jgi:small subunit ribosomal protein S16
MSVKLRLARAGAKKNAFYRVVVTNSRSPRDGRFIEQVGIYNPKTNPPVVKLETARVEHWLKNGAVPTRTVAEILHREEKAAAAAAPVA